MSEMLDVLRTEQKYRLNLWEMSKMSARLSAVLQRDAHGAGGGYTVRSLYFDTLRNKDFREKLDGLACRQKIRLRVYSADADVAKLELKEKQGNLQRKRSLLLNRDESTQICQGNYESLVRKDTEFALELYGKMKQYEYRPVCLIEYERRAFCVPVNDTRVTLDYNLRVSPYETDLFCENPFMCPVDTDGMGTMELKYNRFLLSYVKGLVSMYGYMPTSASKYAAARAVL